MFATRMLVHDAFARKLLQILGRCLACHSQVMSHKLDTRVRMPKKIVQ